MDDNWNVLLLGGGGREHAIAHAILSSSRLKDLKVYPGNGGFPESMVLPLGTLGWRPEDKTTFINHVRGKYDLVVVGPEDPLVNGVADWCVEIGIPCFGPSKYCSQLEGSKDFAKRLMLDADIQTASYATFTNIELAREYVYKKGAPIVIKADGLAGGKGVTVSSSIEEAEQALREIFIDKKFGLSGNKVVIEEVLEGEEASVFAVCDGKDFILLPAVQDHKRAFDGDKGPNTGGMGAYCPAPIADSYVMDQVKNNIVAPILNKFIEQQEPYIGILFVGLMIDSNRTARVVEFNCRLGDPETQAVLLLVEDDLLEIFMRAARGNLGDIDRIQISPGSASVVVLAAEGYPGNYIKDIPLDSIQSSSLLSMGSLKTNSDMVVFHSGTCRSQDGNLISTGGRILSIANRSLNLKESIDKNYKFLESLSIPSTFYRKDIGRRAL